MCITQCNVRKCTIARKYKVHKYIYCFDLINLHNSFGLSLHIEFGNNLLDCYIKLYKIAFDGTGRI